MATKKTATKTTKKLKIEVPPMRARPDPRSCTHMDNRGNIAWTSYGINQPDNGETFEVCLICGADRALPNTSNTMPKKNKAPVYEPLRLRGEAAPLFDLAAIPMTKEGEERERRKQQRQKSKEAQEELNKRAEAQHHHE